MAVEVFAGKRVLAHVAQANGLQEDLPKATQQESRGPGMLAAVVLTTRFLKRSLVECIHPNRVRVVVVEKRSLEQVSAGGTMLFMISESLRGCSGRCRESPRPNVLLNISECLG